jgi:hypothetical protein
MLKKILLMQNKKRKTNTSTVHLQREKWQMKEQIWCIQQFKKHLKGLTSKYNEFVGFIMRI